VIAWGATPVRLPVAADAFVHAVDVNARGAVLAESTTGVGTAPRQRSFVWRDGKVVRLRYGGAAWVDVRQINDRGDVIGDARGEGVLWRNGKPTPLGRFEPSALNDSDVVVGDGTVGGEIHGFVWERGVLTDIGSLGGSETHAWAVNARGQVVGAATTAAGAEHAILWQDGVLTDLGTLPGLESTAIAINDAGLVVGRVSDHLGNDSEAVLWRDGTLVELGRFGAGGATTVGVDRGGDVLVEATTSSGDPLRAFVVHGGTTTALPLVGGGSVVATGLDDAGDVLGYVQSGSLGRRSFVWRKGRVTLLPTTDGRRPPWGGPSAIANGYAVGDEYVSLANGRATSRAVLWRR